MTLFKIVNAYKNGHLEITDLVNFDAIGEVRTFLSPGGHRPAWFRRYRRGKDPDFAHYSSQNSGRLNEIVQDESFKKKNV
jgi:hypothetical protein